MKNKNLEYYLSLQYPVTLEPDEDGGWIARNPDLGTIGDGATEEEAIASLREARELWIPAALEANLPIPEPATI